MGKKILRILKKLGLAILGIIVLVAIVGILFLNISPQFGRSPSKAQKTAYAQYSNYKDGIFINQSATPMDIDFWAMVKKARTTVPNRNPDQKLPLHRIDSLSILNYSSDKAQLTWFGHSTFLLQIDGKIILIDPMFGDSPSPLSFLGPKRFSQNLPIQIEQLPFIDAVILSHDHYDHLDYPSILKLKGKVGRYFTPIGVGNHLERWGVEKAKIEELNWWETARLGEIELVCAPARHFSGRGLLDRFTTLWSSWVIRGAQDNIFFSGDGGYDQHFKEIGAKYGPFDIALMECGQYDAQWPLIHLSPEQTAQAAVDLDSKLVMPIHWGAFALAFHSWTDPVERLTAKAEELGLQVATPEIGAALIVGDSLFPQDKWWKK